MRTSIVALVTIVLVGCVGIDDDPLPAEAAARSLTSCPPPVPVLYAPSGDTSDSTPLYSWSEVPGATSYLFELLTAAGLHLEFRQYVYTNSHSGIDLSAHADVQMYWKVKSRCDELLSAYSSLLHFRYVPPPPPPPGDGDHDGQCYPSLKACLRECTGVCERRINCGGASAHKCFE